ncbi:MAG: GMC family oxidoreductase [Anaerolineae bacterium]|nr:GMC family oxidoreductase [Anaerolineae bacterium]
MMSQLSAQEKRLRMLLQVVAVGYGLFSLFLLLRAPASAGDPIFGAPVFAAYGCAAWGLVAFMAWFASGDVRRFRWMIVTVSVLLIYGGFVGLIASETAAEGTPHTLAVVSAVVDAVIGALLLAMLASTPPAQDILLPWKTTKPQTAAERALTPALFVVGMLAAAISLTLVFGRLSGTPVVLSALNGAMMVGFAATFFGGIAACALLAAFNLRAHGELLTLAIIGGILALLAHLLALLGGSLDPTVITELSRPAVSPELVRAIEASPLLDLLLILCFWWARGWLNRSLIDYLRFFTPGQFWALAAISDGLIEGGERELLKPHEIALRVDNHLSSFPAPKLALSKLAIAALDLLIPFVFALRPPLSFMHLSERRDFINQQFKVNFVETKGIIGLLHALRLQPVIDLVEGVMRFVMQFAYLGYYGDKQVQESIGYQPFSHRARARNINTAPIRRHDPLDVQTPGDLDSEGVDVIEDADVVIIGSGAGGAILAERLLARGRRVLMLEKGRYLKPEDYTEDEIDMIGKLYGDNALQVTSSMRFSILQGSVVGGTTVANNCISFKTPGHILARWNDEFGAGIDTNAYWAAQTAVMERLKIDTWDKNVRTRQIAEVANPISRELERGIAQVLHNQTYTFATMATNIDDCLGCGYCNMGCKYGRKLSMADEVLPKAQADYPGALTILSEAEAVGLHEENGVIREIEVKLGGRRTVTIRKPKTVVVSGGVIASSWLMLRSGIGKSLPIGRRIAFNMGSPLHARFPKTINAYDGLQMSHYLQVKDARDYIFETWFNPPVAQALVMPGWLDTHFANMQSYHQFASMGILVGTEGQDKTHIRESVLFRGSPELDYEPTRRDLDTLVDALILLGKILLASGAEEVYASTRKYHSFTGYEESAANARAMAVYRSEEDLVRYLRQLVHDDDDLLLNSSHPQGGNPLGTVLDPDFRVRGYRNLYVCDASVFPSALTVNPQLTIMNLAWYAGDRVQ